MDINQKVMDLTNMGKTVDQIAKTLGIPVEEVRRIQFHLEARAARHCSDEFTRPLGKNVRKK